MVQAPSARGAARVGDETTANSPWETHMGRRPNIVLVMTDQQRWDTLGHLGFEHAVTPHIDALAERGVSFDHTYVQSALCAPSRASVVTGEYVQAHGAVGNGDWPDASHPNWIDELRQGGYRTVNIGKMHTWPIRLPCGFDYRFVVENKNYEQDSMGGPDDYDLYLQGIGQTRPANRYPQTVEDWWGQLGAAVWPLADEHYPDSLVGRLSVEQVCEHDFDTPLLLWSGFVGPHDPFDVPASALERYGDRPIPEPVCYDNEWDDKPSSQGRGMRKMDGMRTQAAIWWSRATPEAIRRMRRHYYANVMVIDEWVGRIVDAVRERGQLDNTLFVFTSDHGDCLGDHHTVYKFTTHYESVVRVPLVVAGPGVVSRGIVSPLVELIDLGPTLLDLAGVEPDRRYRGQSLRPLLEGGSEEIHSAVYSERHSRVMIRTRRWKLVYYAGLAEGELYDMQSDPDELRNLYNSVGHQEVRAELQQRLLDWYVRERFPT